MSKACRRRPKPCIDVRRGPFIRPKSVGRHKDWCIGNRRFSPKCVPALIRDRHVIHEQILQVISFPRPQQRKVNSKTTSPATGSRKEKGGHTLLHPNNGYARVFSKVFGLGVALALRWTFQTDGRRTFRERSFRIEFRFSCRHFPSHKPQLVAPDRLRIRARPQERNSTEDNVLRWHDVPGQILARMAATALGPPNHFHTQTSIY